MFQEGHLAAEFFFRALAGGEWFQKRRHQDFPVDLIKLYNQSRLCEGSALSSVKSVVSADCSVLISTAWRGITWSAATGSIVGGCKGRLIFASSNIEFSPGNIAGLAPASVLLNSSRLTSLSQVRLKSSEARRNSARFFPNVR